MTYARTGSTAEALYVKGLFNLPEDFTASPEAAEAIREGLTHWLQQGRTEAALESREAYGLPKDYFKSADFEPAIREGFASLAKEGDIEKIFLYSNKFNISDDIFFSPETKMNIRGTISRMLQASGDNLDLSDIDVLAQAFDIESDLKSPMFKQAAGKMFERLKRTDREKAEELRELFGLPEDFFSTRGRASTTKNEGAPEPKHKEAAATEEEELKKVRQKIFKPRNTASRRNETETTDYDEANREREKRQERIIRNVLLDGGFRVNMDFESIGMAKG